MMHVWQYEKTSKKKGVGSHMGTVNKQIPTCTLATAVKTGWTCPC